MKLTTIQNWTIESKNLNFSVLTSKNEVCIKSVSADKNELFYGELKENSVSIYSLDCYQVHIEIDTEYKTIKLSSIEYGE
ncbi:hypothetical protein [Enterococcus sp. DIV1420a]|uniref:hypothetical protein n=1 Tax=Enterococcus TaxID=1350 RepID=UPI003F24FB06